MLVLANVKAQEAVPDLQLSRCPMRALILFFSAAEGRVPSSTQYVGVLQRIPLLGPGVAALFGTQLCWDRGHQWQQFTVRGYHIHWLAENIMIKPVRQFLFDQSRGILPSSAAQDLVLWQGLYHRRAWSQHWGHISIFSFLVLSTVSVSRGQMCSELWHRFQRGAPLLLDSRAPAGVALGIFPGMW